MKTDAADSQGHAHAPPRAAASPSPLRLIVLLSLLLVMGGALLYDWVIAPPRVKAAYQRVLDTVTKQNAVGFPAIKSKEAGEKGGAEATTSGLFYSEDIQKIIGMAPSKVEKSERYTIEHYRWWGWIPRNSNYITVLYVGDQEKKHYSTHYANELPEDEAIPGKKKAPPPVNLESDSSGANAATPGGPSRVAPTPGGMGPGMGAPGGRGGPGGRGAPGGTGGRGRGRPAGTPDTKSADEGSKKSDEPKPNEDSAKEPGSKSADATKDDQEAPAKVGAKESK